MSELKAVKTSYNRHAWEFVTGIWVNEDNESDEVMCPLCGIIRDISSCAYRLVYKENNGNLSDMYYRPQLSCDELYNIERRTAMPVCTDRRGCANRQYN